MPNSRLTKIPLITALRLFCSASIAAIFTIDVYVRYWDDISEAKKAASNYAAILAEHASSTFRGVDTKLRAVEEIRSDLLDGTLNQTQATSRLRDLIIGSRTMVAVGWTDAEGNVVAHSYAGPPPRSNVSGMSHFIAQRYNPDGGLFIAPPFRSAATNTWLSAASRRLSAHDGSFAGIATTPIDQSYFTSLFRSIDLGPGGTILLLHRNGQILARQPTLESAMGKSFADSPVLTQHVPRSSAGSYEITSSVDGVARIAGYRVVPDFPVVVLVSYSRADVLARWHTHVYTFGPLAFILIAIILYGTHHLTRQSEDLRIAKEVLTEALDATPDGFVVYDNDDRLIVCNRSYKDIYAASSPAIVPGATFEDVIRYGISHGQYPEAGDTDEQHREWLAKRIESHRASSNTTTQRLRDGRWLQIRERCTPSGYTVGFRTDVTELVNLNMRFEAAIDNMSQGLCLFDANKRLVVSNRRFREIYGLTEAQVEPGTSLSQILQAHAQNGEKSDQTLDALVDQMPARPFEEWTLADGRVVVIRRKSLSDGGWVATHEDITQQRVIEKERDRNRLFLNQIIEHIPTQIIVKDAHTRQYVLLNRTAKSQLGSSSELIGKTCYDVFTKQTADTITADDDAALRGGQTFSSEHEFEQPKRGGTRFITATRVAIRDENGVPSFLISLIEDVTERKKSNDRIAFLAHHDQLTGLANRAYFAEKLGEIAKRSARHGTPFSVLLLDLDRFKYVNDTLGHSAGDQLLVQVAQRLRASLRDTDVVARLGGDEFAIIQEGEANQHEGAGGLALRIIDLIGKPFDLNGNQANIGTSIGIVFAPECGLDSESLLHKADLALYEAKSEGRNDYRIFKPAMAAASDAQRLLEADLRAAMQKDELELHYQPVVDAKTGLICGAEALVRWRHPSRGLVFPDQFIPLAESTGLMMPLGEWVLQKACQDAASWPPHIKVAINISAVQFNSANLFDVILCTLVQSGLAPERLELEITETMLLKNEQTSLLTIRHLKNLGITIVLDDFGIGYSSSSYLTRMPFDKIKIDRSFVQSFPERREQSAIVQSMVALARGLDMTITAEGVETQEQLEALRSAGVQLVQGYLFGRPVPLHFLSLDPHQARDVA